MAICFPALRSLNMAISPAKKPPYSTKTGLRLIMAASSLNMVLGLRVKVQGFGVQGLRFRISAG